VGPPLAALLSKLCWQYSDVLYCGHAGPRRESLSWDGSAAAAVVAEPSDGSVMCGSMASGDGVPMHRGISKHQGPV
jgi:hypothetical protein